MEASREKWESGLTEEIAFWDDWLAGRTIYAEDRALRLSSGRPFPWWAKPLIPGDPSIIRVLDVGAGPLTALGDQWDGREVRIFPVDPLAEAYNDLLEKYAIIPPVKTEYGLGEDLTSLFGETFFHFAYACNCLDHAVDPVVCYQQMLAVLKPGCSLVTFHEAEEGIHQNYAGLHQWNFSVENGRVKVWNPQGKRDLIEHCPLAGSFQVEGERKYIRLTITRR